MIPVPLAEARKLLALLTITVHDGNIQHVITGLEESVAVIRSHTMDFPGYLLPTIMDMLEGTEAYIAALRDEVE